MEDHEYAHTGMLSDSVKIVVGQDYVFIKNECTSVGYVKKRREGHVPAMATAVKTKTGNSWASRQGVHARLFAVDRSCPNEGVVAN